MAEDAKYIAFSWIKGFMGEEIVRKKIFSNLSKSIKLIDGHEPFAAKNLKPLEAIDAKGRKVNVKLQHLDIVGMTNKKEIKFICEVKTTITSKKEFKGNGFCIPFMVEASKKKIPIYFAVVRLTRDFNPSIIKNFDPKTNKFKINKQLKDNEMAYALKHASVEFCKNNDFKIIDNTFVITK